MRPRIQLGVAAHKIESAALLVVFIPGELLFVRDLLDIIYSEKNKFLRALHRLCLRDIFGGNESV